jgi:hypothetical protein
MVVWHSRLALSWSSRSAQHRAHLKKNDWWSIVVDGERSCSSRSVQHRTDEGETNKIKIDIVILPVVNSSLA